MNKVVKNVLIVINLLLGLVVLFNFTALIYFPNLVLAFLFNYFLYVLLAGTLLTIVIYYFGSKTDKKVDAIKNIDSLLVSTPIFLIVFPLIIFLLLLVAGYATKSPVASQVSSLFFPSYYITLILLPQLLTVGYVLPAKIKTLVANFFARFNKIITILTILVNAIGFGFIVSLVFYPTFSLNTYFGSFALPVYFVALVLAIIVVLVRLRSLKEINLIDYLPFLALIIVILGFVNPNLLGIETVSLYAYVFYLVPVIMLLLNLAPNKWNIRISKNK